MYASREFCRWLFLLILVSNALHIIVVRFAKLSFFHCFDFYISQCFTYCIVLLVYLMWCLFLVRPSFFDPDHLARPVFWPRVHAILKRINLVPGTIMDSIAMYSYEITRRERGGVRLSFSFCRRHVVVLFAYGHLGVFVTTEVYNMLRSL